jgi:hypothetical protein
MNDVKLNILFLSLMFEALLQWIEVMTTLLSLTLSFPQGEKKEKETVDKREKDHYHHRRCIGMSYIVSFYYSWTLIILEK